MVFIFQHFIWALGNALLCASAIKLSVNALKQSGEVLGWPLLVLLGSNKMVWGRLSAPSQPCPGQGWNRRKERSQGKGCGYLWNWFQKAVSWEWGRKLLDFLGKTPVDQCDSIRWAAFNNLFIVLAEITLNLCSSHSICLRWELLFPSFALPFCSLHCHFSFLFSKVFVRMKWVWGNRQGYMH